MIVKNNSNFEKIHMDYLKVETKNGDRNIGGN